jgi:putative sterol carrier protein
MSFANPKFPASGAFDTIAKLLTDNPSDRESAIKQTKAVFGIKLKNGDGELAAWIIDLKDKGEVKTAELDDKGDIQGEKPTVTLSLSEEDFGKLVSGTGNAQKLFMSGKLKVSGDLMKSTKLEPILKKAQTKAKL